MSRANFLRGIRLEKFSCLPFIDDLDERPRMTFAEVIRPKMSEAHIMIVPPSLPDAFSWKTPNYEISLAIMKFPGRERTDQYFFYKKQFIGDRIWIAIDGI